MKTKTSLLIGIAVLGLAMATPLYAQTNAELPSLTGTAGAVTAGFLSWLDNNQAAKTATNWTIAPYATVALQNSPGVPGLGGGVFGAYHLTDFASAGIAIDWLGQLTMPSGQLTLKLPVKPFAWAGFATNFYVVPFVIGAVATPLGAGQDWSLASIYGGGISIPVAKLSDTASVSAGAAIVRWDNAGKYSGNRLELFAAFHLNKL